VNFVCKHLVALTIFWINNGFFKLLQSFCRDSILEMICIFSIRYPLKLILFYEHMLLVFVSWIWPCNPYICLVHLNNMSKP